MSGKNVQIVRKLFAAWNAGERTIVVGRKNSWSVPIDDPFVSPPRC
jgi:hypothetical protein